jgi:hypothetical protein
MSFFKSRFLKERVSLTNMDKENDEVLQSVDEEYIVIMKALWERLKKTHKLRVVK